jgi:hypothetical protein
LLANVSVVFSFRSSLANGFLVNAARHSWRDPAQNVSPVGQARIGDGADDHPFVFRSDRKETGNELLGLGRVRADRTRDKAEIDSGVLRLLECLRMKQHAHGRRDMRIVRLGPIVIDPLLDNAERGTRIDLRRLLCMRGLNQHERGGNESGITHVMLLRA